MSQPATHPVDAGALDAGALDAGALDVGAVDAGAVDAGSAESIRRRVIQLGDDDPAVRREAENQLVQLGLRELEVSRAMRVAATSDDPELAARADAVLARMRWEGPNDPEPVLELIVGAGNKPTAERCERIDRLADLPNDAGRRALFRIVRRDASPRVQWYVVDRLRKGPPPFDPPALAELESADASPAALALAGWAWEGQDYDRSGKLFQRALDASPMPARARAVTAGGGAGSGPDPAGVVPVPDFVFDALLHYHNWARQYGQAARTLRRQIDEGAIVTGTPNLDKLDELIAMQGAQGPLPGLGWDLIRAASSGALGRPQVLYGLNRLCLRKGWRVTAAVARQYAFVESGPDQWRRHAVGMFLACHEWDDLAELELREVLALGDAVGNTNSADAHLIIAMAEMRHGDHAGAYRELEAGLDRASTLNLQGEVEGRTLTSDQVRRSDRILMQGHGLFAARETGDKPAQLERATELARLITEDAKGDATGPLPLGFNDLQNFTMAAVPVLKEAGKGEAAARLFGRAYDSVADWLRREPDNALAMNAIAVLCANCGERLDEARALSMKAVAKDPDNGYFLDCLADSEFQLGNVEEAIKLEKQAARKKSFPPNLPDQLRRFEAGRRAGGKSVTRRSTVP